MTTEQLAAEERRCLTALDAARRGRGERLYPSPGALAAALQLRNANRTSPALDLLDDELVSLFDGGTHDRLMFFMPPQEGKTQRISRALVLWLLQHDPTQRIALVSYASDLAVRNSLQVRRDIEQHPEMGIRLAPDKQKANEWETVEGGGVRAVGITGGITGSAVDTLIIDDPVAGRAEAESPAYRNAAWGWWESNGSTRQSERFKAICVMTRWHEDDLAGRLETNEPGEWRVVRVPAIAEDGDPLGRAPGEELPSVRGRLAGFFRHLKQIRSAYVWRSIYQQAPTAAEGNLFKRNLWQYWEPGPEGMWSVNGRNIWLADTWRFATVDLAASTKTSADWTVVTAFALTIDGELLVLDRVRSRMAESEHIDLALPLVRRWGLDTVYIEKGWIGTQLVVDLTVAGVPVLPVDPDADKVTRALPAVSRQQAKRIFLPQQAAWLDEWMDEHAEFPSGVHDDQVDTLAYGVRVAGSHWSPAGYPPVGKETKRKGTDAPAFNYMTQEW